MGFLIGLGIGFGIGWLLFKRPEWVELAVAWIKEKLVGWGW